MILTASSALYKAFGFAIQSAIPLPELQRIDEVDAVADIIITIGDLTALWQEKAGERGGFVIEPDFVMFEIVNHAIFCIRDGQHITISLAKGHELDVVRLYLLGTCMGALLMQRRLVPLHGSAVAVDKKCYAFVGDSGAGKSTLASAFLAQGYELVSDDVISLSLVGRDKDIVVTPSYPQQKLWQQSLDQLGMNANGYRSVYGREKKYCVPVGSQYTLEQLPLECIIELRKTERGEIEMAPITSLDRLLTLFAHTYRNFMLAPLGLLPWHFDMSTHIAAKTSMFRMSRPEDSFTAHDLTHCILNTLKRKEGSR